MSNFLTDVLTEEENQQLIKDLTLIEKYEAGDESLLDDMIDLLSYIYEYTKASSKIIRKYNFSIMFSKIISKLGYGELEVTSPLYDLCDENFAYYKECIRILKTYLDRGFKTEEFPDLEAAYLLHIYLNGLLFNMNDYLSEIRAYENAYDKSYTYFGKKSIYPTCDERRNKVKALIDAISPENNHE